MWSPKLKTLPVWSTTENVSQPSARSVVYDIIITVLLIIQCRSLILFKQICNRKTKMLQSVVINQWPMDQGWSLRSESLATSALDKTRLRLEFCHLMDLAAPGFLGDTPSSTYSVSAVLCGHCIYTLEFNPQNNHRRSSAIIISIFIHEGSGAQRD